MGLIVPSHIYDCYIYDYCTLAVAVCIAMFASPFCENVVGTFTPRRNTMYTFFTGLASVHAIVFACRRRFIRTSTVQSGRLRSLDRRAEMGTSIHGMHTLLR